MTRSMPPERGTRACYVTGCGHDECRAANTAYQAAWRDANRWRLSTYRQARKARRRAAIARDEAVS